MARLATSKPSVGPRKEEEEGTSKEDNSNTDNPILYDDKDSETEKIQDFDLGRARKELEVAERRLDRLEGAAELAGEQDVCEIFSDEIDLECKIHASDWQVGGACFFGDKVEWDTLSRAEQKKSSTYRELRGIKEGVLAIQWEEAQQHGSEVRL